MLLKLIIGLAIGGLCGFAANKIMKGPTDSILRNVILGVVGGAVGGFMGNLIGAGDGWIMSIILAIAGSCLIVWIARKIVK